MRILDKVIEAESVSSPSMPPGTNSGVALPGDWCSKLVCEPQEEAAEPKFSIEIFR